ncbi:response regulator transcription factor [Nocardioides sp. KR10-350]|uniref:response regulator transcription factor n=1 Tax=Nocardioides cheoyonin TaxID=3156615 RepID=UPI0032B414CB
MTRAVIADDHPVYRDGLRGVLEDLGVAVVAEAGDGLEAVAAVAEHRPDVVLMDLAMPALGGVEATRLVVRDHPGTAVLVLTMSQDPASLQAALTAGARGYLLKEASRGDIARALEAVGHGELIVAAGVAAGVPDLVRAEARSAFPQLTEAEHRVLDLMARGLDNTAIARRLFLAEKTVRNRVSAVLAKLHVESRSAAIATARDHGLGVD